MKKSIFSNLLILTFLTSVFFANAQVRVKSSNSSSSKRVLKNNRTNNSVKLQNNRSGNVVQNNRSNTRSVRSQNNRRGNVVQGNRSNYYNNRGRVRGNANRVVVAKPNRPRVIVNRPSYNRPGYIWRDGYWRWNDFYGQYIWQEARWLKIKRNHFWVPGFWQITAGGFLWVEGYWQLEI